MLCARPNQEQGNCGHEATVTIDTTTSYTLHSRSVFGTPYMAWEVNVTQCTPRTVTVTTAGLGALYDPPTLRLVASFVGLTHGGRGTAPAAPLGGLRRLRAPWFSAPGIRPCKFSPTTYSISGPLRWKAAPSQPSLVRGRAWASVRRSVAIINASA